MDWHVLYVNSRAEAKVAERLSLIGLEVFCPMKTEVKQWSDRKKKVTAPYFRSYVFVQFETKMRLEVLQTPGVVGFVHWLHRPAVIREAEMKEVMRFFEEHKQEPIACHAFEPGENLLIKEGPLKEKVGIVLRQSKHKVVLQIQQLGISLSVELLKEDVAKK